MPLGGGDVARWLKDYNFHRVSRGLGVTSLAAGPFVEGLPTVPCAFQQLPDHVLDLKGLCSGVSSFHLFLTCDNYPALAYLSSM